ncbi:MAG: hypothetical protein KF683_12210, partial [Rubrivivax sp.]|nr:hypothetical protein [Rubrivivax sp.]
TAGLWAMRAAPTRLRCADACMHLPRRAPEPSYVEAKPARACENRRFARQFAPAMDTEQINAIGTLLADLSERTEQLRGYL